MSSDYTLGMQARGFFAHEGCKFCRFFDYTTGYCRLGMQPGFPLPKTTTDWKDPTYSSQMQNWTRAAVSAQPCTLWKGWTNRTASSKRLVPKNLEAATEELARRIFMAKIHNTISPGYTPPEWFKRSMP